MAFGPAWIPSKKKTFWKNFGLQERRRGKYGHE
jgi:hypothetical protein